MPATVNPYQIGSYSRLTQPLSSYPPYCSALYACTAASRTGSSPAFQLL